MASGKKTTTGRGARASRSSVSVHAKPAAKRKAIAKQPATKQAVKQPAAKQPAAKQSAAKQPAAKQPAAKQPVARKPAAKRPAAKQPAAQRPTARNTAARKPAANPASAATQAAPAAPAVQRRLGEITVPSGTLAIFDIGLFGFLPREALEPAIITASVPADRALSVIGVPVAQGRFTHCWDHIAVVLGHGTVTQSKKLGEAGVDCARLVCVDHAALDQWQHEDSLDGRADFVFSGRDAALLAAVMLAPRVEAGYGWTNLPVADAESKADEAARRKASNKWLLSTDLRPHSHHFHALAAARRSSHGAGTLELGGSRMLLFFTSWGDGVFPVYLDRDADDHPVQIRIQLATAAALAAVAGR